MRLHNNAFMQQSLLGVFFASRGKAYKIHTYVHTCIYSVHAQWSLATKQGLDSGGAKGKKEKKTVFPILGFCTH